MQIGYKLATEGFAPKELIRQAVLAEQAGFDFVEMSDHYHPWTDKQGQSPFVWSVIGALAAATDLQITTAVTCPLPLLALAGTSSLPLKVAAKWTMSARATPPAASRATIDKAAADFRLIGFLPRQVGGSIALDGAAYGRTG